MEIVGFSPLLARTILAQNKQILPLKSAKPVDTPASIRVSGYHNNLKDMMRNNIANILAVILRTMNAQDDDGNGLIQGDENGVSLLPISNERLVNEKSTSYIITNGASSKYLSGYYFENNQYYVYQNKQLSTNDPFSEEPNMVIGLDDPLYGYYQSLNS